MTMVEQFILTAIGVGIVFGLMYLMHKGLMYLDSKKDKG